MGNRLNIKEEIPTVMAALRATRDERNRIIKILEVEKVKLSEAAMVAIMEGDHYDRRRV
ncbi:MAG: hypothetical protein WCO24_03855 [Actinomycetes bacterium]